MKLLLVIVLAISLGTLGIGLQMFPVAAFAQKATFVDSVEFIQYLDENTALEEVRNGNLDLYYYRISSDRLETAKSREGLQVFESTGGSYSLLINPAQADKFNPFSIDEVRFALNYLVDRKLIVNELMGGYGTVMISNYGPFDPDYLYIVDQLESFHFRYNPSLAEKIIAKSLHQQGAQKVDGVWMIDGEPVEVTMFIRNDDPVRKSIGEILSSELQRVGFKVTKDFGDLNKAFVVVYGSDPAKLKWSIYTEGWGGRSAFIKYDSVGLGQMYSPWFSNMPGFNDPSYWNYKNDYLDSLTQKIYAGNFSSAQDRVELFQKATEEGVQESVRIFLASKIDQYVANERIRGVVNDLGAGVPSRFTPINSRSTDAGNGADSLVIGVKQIYQGSWNPIGGITDVYSRHIWDAVADPGVFKHPYNGDAIPVRTTWSVQTAGPDGKLEVPQDAIIWNNKLQQWQEVGPGTQATSKVTYDLAFSKWHNGITMDMNDILHSHYFVLEWGSEQTQEDKTFDTEYTPRALQIAKTLVGIKPIDEDTIEVYINYWHFDDDEIASRADVWSTTPWEIMSAMEQAVIDGKVSFSRSGAVSKNVNWLSLIVPNDAETISQYLEGFRQAGQVPASLETFESAGQYFKSRYDSSLEWIEKYNHAVVSNGPFFVERYSPESRTITIKAFSDASYPYEAGAWNQFETTQSPAVIDVDLPEVVVRGQPLAVAVTAQDSSEVQYFFTSAMGSIVASGVQPVSADDVAVLSLSSEKTQQLGEGANDLKVFAVSESFLRPDIFSASFLAVSDSGQGLPQVQMTEGLEQGQAVQTSYSWVAIVVGGIIVGSIWYIRKKRNKNLEVR